MSVALEDFDAAVSAGAELGGQLKSAMQRIAELEQENEQLKTEHAKLAAEEPPAPQVVLEKVALSRHDIDNTLDTLTDRAIIATAEARHDWEQRLLTDPNEALKLASRVAEILIHLPAAPEGEPVKQSSVQGKPNSLRQLASPMASAGGNSSWFSN